MKCATGWCQWIKWCHFLLSSLDEICTVWCLPSQSVVRQEQFSADCRLTSISCSSDDFLHLLTLATLLNNQWTPSSISFFLLVNCFGVWDSSYLANQSLCWYPILISVGVSVLISDYLSQYSTQERAKSTDPGGPRTGLKGFYVLSVSPNCPHSGVLQQKVGPAFSQSISILAETITNI